MQIDYQGVPVHLPRFKTYYLPVKKDPETGKWVEWDYEKPAKSFGDNINEVINNYDDVAPWYNSIRDKYKKIVHVQAIEADQTVTDLFLIVTRKTPLMDWSDMIDRDRNIIFDNLEKATRSVINHDGPKYVFAIKLPI